ncbi:MAG: secretin N-terminal domain-containing protein, partial [Chlamydiia bacterium]
MSPTICYTQSAGYPHLAASLNTGPKESADTGPSYTVNFNNVPIIEVIRFVSKVTNMNFVFSQQDIQFNVSIISEEPITVKNILSALIQVLRINNLTLLEQDNSLIITKNQDVNQIPTIVSGDIPNSDQTMAPLITRVFRIKNANASSVANIIRTMTSKAAQIEVSNETRQLIVTDITTNVDKIASLLSSLDAPHTPLEIDSYEVRNIAPADMIALTTQILSPFTEGNPLIFVPQAATNTVFIVSTPYLLERSISVMEDLDILPKEKTFASSTKLPQLVFFYPIQNRSSDEMMGIIKQTAADLQIKDPFGSALLIESLQSATYIPETNSLRIITDATTWTTAKSILNSADILNSTSQKVNFIYNAKNGSNEQLQQTLLQTAQATKDADLILTVKNAQLLKSSNSLFFSGSQSSITQIQNIISNLDVAQSTSTKTNFLVYTPKNQSV